MAGTKNSGTTAPLVEEDGSGGHRPHVWIANPGEISGGGGGGGGGGAVTVVDGGDTTQGAKADAAASADTGTFTVVAILKRGLARITTLLAALPAALTGSGNFKVAMVESTASQAVTGTVAVSSSALPTGAATETTLAGIKTGTDKIPASPATDRATAASPAAARLSDGTAFYKATTPSDTQPVSATSLPLPSGAATEATLGGVLTTTDFDSKTGALTETAPATDTASSGLNGRLQRIAQRLTSLIALLPAALTGSGNLKVAMVESTAAQAVTNANLDAALSTLLTTSDFDSKAGSLTETAPATDTASSGLNGRLQRIAQRLTSLIALFPTALGATTAANSFPVTLSTDGQFVVATGSITETAPATDTASSGVNGRLQRIAQRLTSLIALLPSALVSGRLDVNVGASANLSVGGLSTTSSATLTRPANTTAYASGDEMTDTGGSILTFANVAKSSGSTAVLNGVIISNSVNAATKASGELRLYDTTSTPATDNAAFDAADGVNDTCVAVIPFSSASDGLTGTTGNCIYDIDVNKLVKCVGTSLFGRIILKAAYTSPSNSDTWKITLKLLQDV